MEPIIGSHSWKNESLERNPRIRLELAAKIPQIKQIFLPHKSLIKDFFSDPKVQRRMQEITDDPKFWSAARQMAKPNISLDVKRKIAEKYLYTKPWYEKLGEAVWMGSGKLVWNTWRTTTTASVWVLGLISMAIITDFILHGGMGTDFVIQTLENHTSLDWRDISPWIPKALQEKLYPL